MGSVSNVPTEILTEIFLHACETFYSLPDPPSRLVDLPRTASSSPVVVTISSVCSRWRSIATSTPQLWSRFRLIAPLLPRSSELLLLFLDRAGNNPLDFCLYLFDVKAASAVSVRLLRSIFRHLVGEAHRWRNVQILLPPSSQYIGVPSFDLSDWPQNLPMLETLFLDTPGDPHKEILSITPNMTMPHLRVLTLKGRWAIRAFDLSGRIDWSGSLHISPAQLVLDMDYLHWGAIEFASPSTVVQIRRFCGVWVYGDVTCQTRRLEIYPGPIRSSNSSHIPLDTVLRQIGLPNATELVFGRDLSSALPVDAITTFKPFVFPHDALISLLSRRCNAEKLTHFSLLNYIISDSHLFKILTHLPSLTFLAIDERFPYSNEQDNTDGEFALTKTFFCALTQSSIDPKIPIASLEEFKLAFHPNHLLAMYNNSSLEECTTSLLDMVESRAIGRGRYLKKVSVHFEVDCCLNDERIQALSGQGVNFKLGWNVDVS
ncbi:hypothetical protein VKT23_018525 [Stygiomarasmius scandens]|uniref:F-box domain-containing protein n=1 Tax=Marasmiellus scandens TaxID=2682957 RepID=A0ABR1ISH7_9AGAR